MPSLSLRLILSGLAIIEFLLVWILTVLNIHSALKSRTGQIGPLSEYFDVPTCQRSADYSIDKSQFSLIQVMLTTALILIVLATNLPGLIKTSLPIYSLPEPFGGLFYLMTLAVLSGLIQFPLSIFRTFVLEEKHGFNRITPRLFFSDLIKQSFISGIFISILYSALSLLFRFGGPYWWVMAWIAYSAFQLIILFIYPVLIAPLFNKFSKLESGPHLDAIETLARSCGFHNSGIFVMDGSKRSSHGNAYFTGYGKARRIVFFDTLLKDLTPEESSAVLAHEIGHWKKKHLIKRTIAQFLTSLYLFWLFTLGMNSPALFNIFGFPSPSLDALIIIVMLMASPLSIIINPVSHFISRRQEFEADHYSRSVMKSGYPLAMALIKLGRANLTQLLTYPLYSGYFYSHPVLSERVGRLLKEST